MRIGFRLSLTWLLLLALPLQGFAAATMINCGPNHHRMMVAAMADTPKAQQHHHEMGVATDHHEGASNDGDAPSVHHLDKLMKFKCSACAACCMGAALPTAALSIASLPPAMTTAAFVSTPHADFLSDGLDRPPRLLLV